MNDQHPYAKIIENGDFPEPTPCNFYVDDVKYEIGDTGETHQFARIAIASTNGIYVFHLSEGGIHGFMQNLAALLRGWNAEKNKGLVVANNQDMKNEVRRRGLDGQNGSHN